MVEPAYREYAPPPAVAHIVGCLWTVRADAPLARAALNRVLPDGCTDLIFNLGDNPAPDDLPHYELRAYVVGPMTRALRVRHVGRVEFVGARFRPGAAGELFRVPAAQLTDRAIRLDELAPRLHAASAPVLESPDAIDAVPALASLLASQITQPAREPLGVTAWTRLERTNGAPPIRDLAADLGVSVRRLQRAFHEQLGITPKAAVRVVRLQAAITLMQRHPDWLLGRVALASGFYDQPHFNRDFASLAGVTPREWRAERVASVQSPAVPPE